MAHSRTNPMASSQRHSHHHRNLKPLQLVYCRLLRNHFKLDELWGNTMKTPPTKRHLQVALALTLLACSGLSGCSDSQEQSSSNTASGKVVVASTHTKAATATPKASDKATSTPTASGTPSATANPTLIMTPELEASKKTSPGYATTTQTRANHRQQRRRGDSYRQILGAVALLHLHHRQG